MSQKRIPNLGFLNTAPIIRNPDKRDPTVLNLHRNSIRSGIYRILHQFLHHTGWTLHNLSRRNLVNRLMIQNINNRHTPLSLSS